MAHAEAGRVASRALGVFSSSSRKVSSPARAGGRREPWATWLSRPEIEALAVAEYRPSWRTGFLPTLAEAAKALGGTTGTVRQRLPTLKASTRRVLVRATDIALAAEYREIYGRWGGPPPTKEEEAQAAPVSVSPHPARSRSPEDRRQRARQEAQGPVSLLSLLGRWSARPTSSS